MRVGRIFGIWPTSVTFNPQIRGLSVCLRLQFRAIDEV